VDLITIYNFYLKYFLIWWIFIETEMHVLSKNYFNLQTWLLLKQLFNLILMAYLYINISLFIGSFTHRETGNAHSKFQYCIFQSSQKSVPKWEKSTFQKKLFKLNHVPYLNSQYSWTIFILLLASLLLLLIPVLHLILPFGPFS